MSFEASTQAGGAGTVSADGKADMLERLYERRFENTGIDKRQQVWRVLCDSFFSKLVPADSTVLDLACGYGEFINNIRARTKYAIDLNTDAAGRVAPDVHFVHGPATDLSALPQNMFDRVFSSNLFEHFKSKTELDQVLASVLKLLKPGGKLILVGPNIRYAYREYWDFYDHNLALSHHSLSEALVLAGYKVEVVVPRFLPYTMNNSLPAHRLLVRLYLAVPLAWRIMGKQFLVVASRPN